MTRTIVGSRGFHGLILGLGALFFLTTAFHGNIWFDESYSVAIASHSFVDIWNIGANDVHPVLFYWALHCLYIVFGENLVVYRLFTIVGVLALASLGLTHVRKDYGEKAGLLFTFFVLSTPFTAQMAVDIRMYSWAMFSVMVCFLYGARIVKSVQMGTISIPVHWWVCFAIASLASAYLHYFAALAVALVNGLVLIALVRARNQNDNRVCHAEKMTVAENATDSENTRIARARDNKIKKTVSGKRSVSPLIVLLVIYIVQLVLYAPWLVAVLNQVTVVSGDYWAKFSFPYTLVEYFCYPFLTSTLTFAVKGDYGIGVQVIALGALAIFFILLCFVVAALIQVKRAGRNIFSCCNTRQVCIGGVSVYFGVLLLGCLASLIMGSLILYFRYLSVALGPLLLSLSLLLVSLQKTRLRKKLCISLLVLALISQGLFFYDDYNPKNQEPLDAFESSINSLPDGSLVLSSDIGVLGVTSVLYPDIDQTYLDWQKGNWGAAYRAYEPALRSVKSWESVLDSYKGTFVVMGQSSDGSIPRDIADISSFSGVTVFSEQTYYRPYERTFFTIAVMEKE